MIRRTLTTLALAVGMAAVSPGGTAFAGWCWN